jgi:hypothetical protein
MNRIVLTLAFSQIFNHMPAPHSIEPPAASLNWLTEILPSILGGSSQFFLNTKDLIVLGQSFGPTRSSGLDLDAIKESHKL